MVSATGVRGCLSISNWMDCPSWDIVSTGPTDFLSRVPATGGIGMSGFVASGWGQTWGCRHPWTEVSAIDMSEVLNTGG